MDNKVVELVNGLSSYSLDLGSNPLLSTFVTFFPSKLTGIKPEDERDKKTRLKIKIWSKKIVGSVDNNRSKEIGWGSVRTRRSAGRSVILRIRDNHDKI